MKVHIQGMGVLGSLLAWSLSRAGIDFTWNDSHEEICAWQASTGCVYPSGDDREFDSYKIWKQWHEKPIWSKQIGQITERASYWFMTKKPPHNGDFRVRHTVGPLRNGSLGTVQVNVQALVRGTRKFFRERELHHRGSGILVVAHGFSTRLNTHYKWGWSAEAKLEISDRLLRHCKVRPCIDLKRGIVSPLVYAYPKPGTNVWYAGSSIIRQTKPKELNIPSKIEFWREKMEELTDGLIKVKHVGGPIRNGWRPCGSDESLTKHLASRVSDRIYVKPMSHSGVRMGPLVIQKVMRLLDEY